MEPYGIAADQPEACHYPSQRLRLHYVDWGNAAAPPLLLVHGREDHCRSWDWVARRLRADWHVIAVDLRGHGDSEWSNGADYSTSSYVADFAALCAQWPDTPLTIVAHSMGGNISLRYTGLFPERVRRIATIEGLGPAAHLLAKRSAPDPAPGLREWLAERERLRRQNDVRLPSLEAAYRRLHEKNAHLSVEQAWHLTRHATRVHSDGTVNWKFDYAVRGRTPHDLTAEQLGALWEQIQCPTLLIYGDGSWVSDPSKDGRLRHFRHARYEQLSGAGHWVHHDRLEDVMRLLASHL